MENTESCCIAKILKVIDVLQKECFNECFPEGCEKDLSLWKPLPIYNTRPITLYSRSGNLFTVTYYVNNVPTTSSVFRVENVKGCCAKLRILVSNEDGSYTATNEFLTVNLECFCILRCLSDTSIEL